MVESVPKVLAAPSELTTLWDFNALREAFSKKKIGLQWGHPLKLQNCFVAWRSTGGHTMQWFINTGVLHYWSWILRNVNGNVSENKHLRAFNSLCGLLIRCCTDVGFPMIHPRISRLHVLKRTFYLRKGPWTLHLSIPLQWRIQDFLEGAPTPEEGANLLFGQYYTKNCVKMKKYWARGSARNTCPLDPPLPYAPL